MTFGDRKSEAHEAGEELFTTYGARRASRALPFMVS